MPFMRCLITASILAALAAACSSDDPATSPTGDDGGSSASSSSGTSVGSSGTSATGSGASTGGSGEQGQAGARGSGGSAGVAGSGGSGGARDAGAQGTGGSGGGAVTDARAGDSAAGADSRVASDAAGASDGSVADNTWTGTWASAPQGCGGSFAQRTLREIVRTSIGGTAARVRISNTFSGGALHISDVHLAQRTSGSSIDPATDKALTFNGQPDVTIAAGMFAVSDGAEFVVKPLSDVAVSFYVISNNGATCHQSGFQTNYSAAGNVVGSATLAGAQTNGSYNFLSNLDVLNPSAEGAVVTLGASITDGYVQPTDSNRRWPNDLAVRLVMGNRLIGVLNQGISGDGVANAVTRFDRDVLSQPNVKWVIFSDNAINDLGGNRATAQADIDRMKTMITKAHDKGVKFLCSTLTPYVPAEPGRTTINAFIRGADSGCDGIVDQDTATHDPAAPTRWLAAFNSGDGLHPNVAGLQAIADSVNFTVFKQ
jgi:lysophospholipase L1-like esterase